MTRTMIHSTRSFDSIVICQSRTILKRERPQNQNWEKTTRRTRKNLLFLFFSQLDITEEKKSSILSLFKAYYERWQHQSIWRQAKLRPKWCICCCYAWHFWWINFSKHRRFRSRKNNAAISLRPQEELRNAEEIRSLLSSVMVAWRRLIIVNTLTSVLALLGAIPIRRQSFQHPMIRWRPRKS